MAITATVTASGTTAEASKPLIPDVLTHDPTILQLTWAVAIVSLIVTIGKPIRDYLRGERKAGKEEKVDDAKNNAETVLYTHLSEQVSQYRTLADQAFRERNDLIGRVAALESKSAALDDANSLIDRLKHKLDQKDIETQKRLDKKDEEIQRLIAQAADERSQFLSILQSKEREISRRDERICVLENGLKELELRLVRGEQVITQFTCPMEGGHRKYDPPVEET